MSLFYEIEFNAIPMVYFHDNDSFLKSIMLEKENYMCTLFNWACDMMYQDGMIMSKISFKPNQFEVRYIKYGTENKRLFYIKLPEPDGFDLSPFYCGSYGIAFTVNEIRNTFDIIGLYGTEKFYTKEDNTEQILKFNAMGVYERYKRVVSNTDDIVKAMCELAFENTDM